MGYLRKFNYSLGVATFAPDFEGAFLDKYLLALSAAPVLRDGKLWVKLADLAKVYGPDFTYETDAGAAAVSHGGVTVGCPVEDGAVDALELLGVKLGKPVIHSDVFFAFCEKPAPAGPMGRSPWSDRLDPYAGGRLGFPRGAEDYFRNVIRSKPYGDIFKMYWNEELRRAVPYRLFVPYAYDPAKAWKLIVAFHGGGGSPSSAFVNSGNRLQFLADKYGYIVLAPDAALSGSSYGATETVNGMRNITLDPSNPKNPAGYSEEELRDRRLGEENAEQVIELVRAEYDIDSAHIYLMGNSMGGEATLHFASAHPQLFRAISPAGAMLNTDYFDDAPLGDMPIFVVGGLEDFHGFDYIEQGARALQARGRNLTLRGVGGGEHGTAWVMVIDEIFDFFAKNA